MRLSTLVTAACTLTVRIAPGANPAPFHHFPRPSFLASLLPPRRLRAPARHAPHGARESPGPRLRHQSLAGVLRRRLHCARAHAGRLLLVRVPPRVAVADRPGNRRRRRVDGGREAAARVADCVPPASHPLAPPCACQLNVNHGDQIRFHVSSTVFPERTARNPRLAADAPARAGAAAGEEEAIQCYLATQRTPPRPTPPPRRQAHVCHRGPHGSGSRCLARGNGHLRKRGCKRWVHPEVSQRGAHPPKPAPLLSPAQACSTPRWCSAQRTAGTTSSPGGRRVTGPTHRPGREPLPAQRPAACPPRWRSCRRGSACRCTALRPSAARSVWCRRVRLKGGGWVDDTTCTRLPSSAPRFTGHGRARRRGRAPQRGVGGFQGPRRGPAGAEG